MQAEKEKGKLLFFFFLLSAKIWLSTKKPRFLSRALVFYWCPRRESNTRPTAKEKAGKKSLVCLTMLINLHFYACLCKAEP